MNVANPINNGQIVGVRKHRLVRILFLCSLFLGGAVLVWYFAGDVEPRYGGVSFTKLLQDACHSFVQGRDQAGNYVGGLMPDPVAVDAFRSAGTNAIAPLISLISYDPSPIRLKVLWWTRKLRQTRCGFLVPAQWTVDRRESLADLAVEGFHLLGPTVSGAMPELERLAKPPHGVTASRRAIQALCGMGPSALGPLGRLAEDPTRCEDAVLAILEMGAKGAHVNDVLGRVILEPNRYCSLPVFGLRHLPASNAVSILAIALHSPSAQTRKEAAEIMVVFGNEARNSVPTLVETLHDPDPGVRSAATQTLSILSPEMFVTNQPSASQ